jgi:hypothetical protein
MMSMSDPFRGVSAILEARKRRESPAPGNRLAAACRMKPSPPRAPCGVCCGTRRARHHERQAASPPKMATASLCLTPCTLSASVDAWFHVHWDQAAFHQQRRYRVLNSRKIRPQQDPRVSICLRTHIGAQHRRSRRVLARLHHLTAGRPHGVADISESHGADGWCSGNPDKGTDPHLSRLRISDGMLIIIAVTDVTGYR